MEQKTYFQHLGRAVEDSRFSHMMAIALDPRSHYKKGIIRCITSREGDVDISGYVDRSQLYTVSGDSLEHFIVGERLQIKNEKEILDELTPEDCECIGLEDPDIWIDEKTRLTHLYFTIPIKSPYPGKGHIHLGHAVGEDLDSLTMTAPVLLDNQVVQASAKEVSIAPENRSGVRFNLVESSSRGKEMNYSVVRIAITEDMGKEWQRGEIIFHPAEHHIPWIAEHASPGPLLPRSFIDVGEHTLLGIMNGREASTIIDDTTKLYGTFSVGLFIYDYENGKIEWVSPEPLIRDSEATTITFASQFVETNPGEGILYAHVDDSFVRAYTLYAEGIRALLP
jgi:hypothetical protein